jgi:hypothetical protein
MLHFEKGSLSLLHPAGPSPIRIETSPRGPQARGLMKEADLIPTLQEQLRELPLFYL